MRLFDDFYAYLWPGATMSEMRIYGNNCNSYVIANALAEKKHVIVDPGAVVNEARQNCLSRLASEMEKDGIMMQDIGMIIITHAHWDHYGAAEGIKKRSGSLITMSKEEGDFYQAIGKQMFKALEIMGLDVPEINPDFYIKEGELRLSEKVARILLTPGHSPGHVGIYWPAEKVYMAGDLIFYGSTGRVDFPGGSARLLKESIERVAQLDIEYLLTGHQYGSPGIIEGREQIKSNFEFIRRNVFPYL